MKRLVILVLALVALAMSASPRAEEPARHVVMISIDGLRPLFYTQPGPAKIPTIRRLMQQGAWARGVTGVLPSVTYPSHTTLITGVLPARHGIFDNRILDPEGTSNMAWFWYARDIRVTTLPAAIRARGLTAAAVNWPVTVGMDLDYNMPEIARSRHAENMELVDALSWPKHLIDIYLKTLDKPFGAPWSDMDRAGMAAWLEREFQPNLLLLHIAETDGTAHEYGPDSPEALAAVERADAAIARVLESVEAAGATASTDVVLVSDHVSHRPASRRFGRTSSSSSCRGRRARTAPATSGNRPASRGYPLPPPLLLVRRQVVDEAKEESTAVNAIGQRAMFQKSLKPPASGVLRAIASPRAPPKTISRNVPARTIPVANTSKSEIRRTFQNGRVSRWL